MPPNWIAAHEVLFVHPDGRRSPGRIAVGQPEQVSPDEARCPIALDGYERLPAISGSSTLQALLLGMRLLGMRLHDFINKGGRVLALEDDVDMPLEAVFDDVTPEWTLVKFKPA